MIVTVLIPTYRRPHDLKRCLQALQAQERVADEVIVVVRDGDADTQAFLAGFHPEALALNIVRVSAPGVVAAMNAGLAVSHGDIIALTDDDTAPYPDWLARIESYFLADEQLGGVGGRDWQPIERGNRSCVGKLRWYGRVIGNHHLGVGAAREVDVLKGANCAYRARPLAQIGFDTRLRGEGAQVHWELSLGFAMKRAGWKLIYDPMIAIDHFPAARFDDDQLTRLNGAFSDNALFNATYNETLALWEHLPPFRRAIFLAWVLLVGTRSNPGVLQVMRLAALRQRQIGNRVKANIAGRIAAIGAASTFRNTPETRSSGVAGQ